MRYSGIGGQAVMEGVMMKNGEKYAVAVRKPNREIVVESSLYCGIGKSKKLRNMPVVRGVFNFIESLALGLKTMTFSASFFEEEETAEKNKKKEEFLMGVTAAASVVFAVAIFILLPYGVSLLFQKAVSSPWMISDRKSVV